MPRPKGTKNKVKKNIVKVVTESTNPEPYHLSLKIGSTVYESSGETPYEALRTLPHPEKIVYKGVLTVQKGAYIREMNMFPVRLRRLFWENAQQVQAKVLFPQ